MPSTNDTQDAAAIDLAAVIVAVTGEEPRILTLQDGRALPSGPLESAHRTLQTGLRSWVERQTHHPLGYIEQLYTFADRDRRRGGAGGRIISISYLGLTRQSPAPEDEEGSWQNWYRYLPWEDRRGGPPPWLATILRRLRQWARTAPDQATRRDRLRRIDIGFGDDQSWNEELVLQRYELLYEAGLLPEAGAGAAPALPGQFMILDHRRILATGIARLRAKIKYRPVVFELMPASFTLLQLQRAVEALAGRRLHKQNFRRLIDQQGLVEETGEIATGTGGRPAKLFRFRREVLLERAVAGTKLPLSRSA
ncbi:MAG: NUDIX hydrolase [Stellaceae bacterium]